VAESGSSWALPRLVGTAAAIDLLASGRVVLAEEAFQLGLVNRVVPGERLMPTTMEYAREVASSCSPASVASIKWQVYRHRESGLETALRESLALTDRALAGEDFGEGLAAYRERRPPRFPDLAGDRPRDPFGPGVEM
jgi:enoyl-CoA hydratase/carnithine racemase